MLEVKKSLVSSDDAVENGLLKAAEREANEEIFKLEKQLNELKVKRIGRIDRREKKQLEGESIITKKHFKEKLKLPEVPKLSEEISKTVNSLWRNKKAHFQSEKGNECRGTDLATLIGKNIINVCMFNGKNTGFT